MYIVELQKDCWIAPWDGDPGRTIVKGNAKTFPNKMEADFALVCARQFRTFENAKIIKKEEWV